jgi:hAT family C-terminal dimerisation region
MSKKLNKHYTRTAVPHVYSDAVILNPYIRMAMFDKQWDERYGNSEEYYEGCRKRYMANYSHLADVHADRTTNGKKRNYEEMSNDEGFAAFVKSLHSDVEEPNEFDIYINSKIFVSSFLDLQSILDWWKTNSTTFPALAMMARDVFAVPCTGAGVEREFSKGRRLATWSRSRLHPDTIQKCMMYKDYLARMGKPIGM